MSGGRRGFFREALAGLTKLVEPEEEVTPAPSFVPPPHPPASRPLPAARRVRRPPGAVASFVDLCTRCGECIQACPEGTLFTTASGYPEARIETHPCVMCHDVPCLSACPTGALRAGGEGVFAFGTARILERLCLNHGRQDDDEEAPCERCTDWCPLPGVLALGADAIPVVAAERCTGCGLCAAHCAAYPKAIDVG